MAKRPINASFGNSKLILVHENWKDAPGINAMHKETNAALAQRNYECDCATTVEPVVIVEGYHIWWCVTHHQPLYACEKARLRQDK